MMKPLGNITAALAVFFSILVTTGFVMLNAELAHRSDISMSRGPVYTDSEPEASIAWAIDNAVSDGKGMDIMYYSPRDSNSPIPPGLTSWMSPGAVAISPGLIPETDYVERQFGPVELVISSDVLINPDERIVFVRPSNEHLLWEQASRAERAYYASGFGSADGAVQFGDITYETNSRLLPYLYIVLLVPPLGVFLVTARRLINMTSQRDQYVFQLLGASRMQLAARRFKDAGWGLLGGAIAAVTLVTLATTQNFPLPLASFTLSPEAMEGKRVLFALVTLLSVALALAAIITPKTTLTVRRNPRWRSILKRSAPFIFCIGLLLLAAGTYIFLYTRLVDFEVYFWLAGVLLLCVSLPGMLVITARWAANKAASHDLSGLLLRFSARETSNFTASAAIAGIFLIVGTVAAVLFVAANSSQVSTLDREAQERNLETRISCPNDDLDCLRELTSAAYDQLPDAYSFSLLNSGARDVFVKNYGAVEDLDNLSPILRDYLTSLPHQHATATLTDTSLSFERARILTVVSSPDSIERLQSLRAINTYRIPVTTWQGETDSAAKVHYVHQSRWIIWFFCASFILAVATSTVTSILRGRHEASEFAPIAALGGTSDKLRDAMIHRAVVIGLTTTLVSTATAVVVGLQLSVGTPLPLPIGFLAAMVALLIAASVIQTASVVHTLRHAANTWSPGKVEEE